LTPHKRTTPAAPKGAAFTGTPEGRGIDWSAEGRGVQ
jgi:hypothetical protein